jgi:threonylcarbamoyladenosine tRNA methylthiotransferase CDKAL1
METQYTSSSTLDLEDIEDLFDNPGDSLVKTRANSRLVVPKVKKRRNKKAPAEEECYQNGDSIDLEEKCFLPGQAKIYVKTWGCSHNVSDGEYIAGQLAEQGYMYVITTKNQTLEDLKSMILNRDLKSNFA